MGGYYYTAKQGDTWDYIAWVVYENEYRMEEMMCAIENYDILTTFIFSAGDKVWCPYIEEDDTEDEEPDWRSDD